MEGLWSFRKKEPMCYLFHVIYIPRSFKGTSCADTHTHTHLPGDYVPHHTLIRDPSGRQPQPV